MVLKSAQLINVPKLELCPSLLHTGTLLSSDREVTLCILYQTGEMKGYILVC
jgi:hypothetical protein